MKNEGKDGSKKKGLTEGVRGKSRSKKDRKERTVSGRNPTTDISLGDVCHWAMVFVGIFVENLNSFYLHQECHLENFFELHHPQKNALLLYISYLKIHIELLPVVVDLEMMSWHFTPHTGPQTAFIPP